MIKVRTARGGSGVWVNPDFIVRFRAHPEGSVLQTSIGPPYTVRETPEELSDMIATYNRFKYKE